MPPGSGTMILTFVLALPLLTFIAASDLRSGRIRNRHVILLAVVTVVGLGVVALGEGPAIFVRAALGGALAGLPLVVAGLAEPSRMGGGDIKLAVVLGALLGGVDPVLSLVAIGVGLTLTLLAFWHWHMVHGPFAPGLLGGALLAVGVGALTGAA